MWVNEGSRREQMKGDSTGLGTCRGNRKAVDLSIVGDWYVPKWRSGGQVTGVPPTQRVTETRKDKRI